MTPAFQLEEFFLTSLQIHWKPARSERRAEIRSTRVGFDYDLGNHVSDSSRFRMAFKANFAQLTETGEPAGYEIHAEIVGLFVLAGALSEEMKQAQFRVNGVSVLYGALRGIVASSTGTFPGGKFNLPTFMPQDLVKQIEELRAQKNQEPHGRMKA